MRHPDVSAVVYLTDAGSSTLVTSLHVAEKASASSSSSNMSGYLCPPSKGRVLLFDGGLLHVILLHRNQHRPLFCSNFEDAGVIVIVLLEPLSSS